MKRSTLSPLILAVVVLLCVSLPAVAQEQGATTRPVPSLSVSGMSEVQERPDLATVSLGVQTQSPRLADAIQANNQAMERVVAAVRATGVPERDIQTSTFSVFPLYRSRPTPSGEGEQELIGYRVSNVVTVRLQDVNRVGAVIDAGTGAGANTVQGISFQLQDDVGARGRALAAAAREAQQKARALAEAMGVRLGPVLTVSEQGAEVRPVFMEAALMRAPAAGVPISPGRVTVTANVSVTYRIE